MNIENDIPKYKKKKPQQSKSALKSKHKHEYLPCLFHVPVNSSFKDHYDLRGSYCSICGKVKPQYFLWSSEEFKAWTEANPDAPEFTLKDINQKFLEGVDE